MARDTRPDVRVHVDENGALMATVHVDVFEAHNARWQSLMCAHGTPPGGTKPVSVTGSRLTMVTEAGRVEEALEWLEDAVKKVGQQWRVDEERRRVAQEEARSTLETWWQRVRW